MGWMCDPGYEIREKLFPDPVFRCQKRHRIPDPDHGVKKSTGYRIRIRKKRLFVSTSPAASSALGSAAEPGSRDSAVSIRQGVGGREGVGAVRTGCSPGWWRASACCCCWYSDPPSGSLRTRSPFRHRVISCNKKMLKKTLVNFQVMVEDRVADPYLFDTDPDPAF